MSDSKSSIEHSEIQSYSMPFFSFLDEYSDITDITFNDRKRFAPMDRFSSHLLRGESQLSISERELIAAYVSGLNGCKYCHGTHTAVAKNFGISESLIQDLLNDIDSYELSTKMKPVISFVKKLTLHPSKVIQKDAQAVFDAGWNEKALQDVICICSLFNFYNRLLDGHGVKGSNQLYQIGAEHLTNNGYKVPWFIRYIKSYIRKQKINKLTKHDQ